MTNSTKLVGQILLTYQLNNFFYYAYKWCNYAVIIIAIVYYGFENSLIDLHVYLFLSTNGYG